MKEYLENRAGLFLDRKTYAQNLTNLDGVSSMQVALDQFKSVNDLSSAKIETLSTYLDEIESVYHLIFDGISNKIKYIEDLADSLIASKNQIPPDKDGICVSFDLNNTVKNGTTFISNVGIILETK